MTADFGSPPQVVSLCEHGHVACVQATDVDGDTWCWGWHLIVYDDEWSEIVSDCEHMQVAIERLVAMLVEYEVNHVSCTFTGRTGRES